MKLTYIILIVCFFIGISELKACEYTDVDMSDDYKFIGIK